VLLGLAAIVPIGAQGSSEIVVDLVSLEGNVVAVAKTTLVIATSQPSSPPRAAAPARPPKPVRILPNANRRHLYSKGLELVERGDVDAARRFFERAADMGLSQGAMALATT
jgi:hypothetical protein